MARTGLDPVRFFSLLEILFLLESFLHRLVSTVDRSRLLIHRGLTQRIEVEWNFWIQIPMFRIETLETISFLKILIRRDVIQHLSQPILDSVSNYF